MIQSKNDVLQEENHVLREENDALWEENDALWGEKARFRAIMKTVRARVARDSRQRMADACRERLAELEEYRRAEWVYAFSSFGNEIPTDRMILAALEAGKRVALPRVEGSEIVFYEIRSGEEYYGLRKSAMGIPEPTGAERIVKEPGFMLVPGLGFDPAMHRIGYGGGYYDRYLASCRGVVTAGIGYDCQLVEKVPAGPEDRLLDYIITDQRTIGK